MVKCQNCGEKLKEDRTFCSKCGSPVKLQLKDNKKNKKIDLCKTMKHPRKIYGVISLENLPVGHIIDNRYEVKEKLGQGGYGAVYRVFDKNFSIDKALKLIPYRVAEDREAYESLKSEAKTMIKLNHPNIARVYDFHEEDLKFIDMEFIDGKNVLDLKLDSPQKKLPEEKVKRLALQIAEGLAYAHNKNVIHKDIKPQNIILTKENTIKILDFGIAETVRSSISRINNIATMGTLPYMAPEQILGESISTESDIYSFGITLYELLSGHPPFYRGDITYQVLNKKPKDIEGISPQMNTLVQKSIEKKQEDRFSSFELLISNLLKLDKGVFDKGLTESNRVLNNTNLLIKDSINEIANKQQLDLINNSDLLKKLTVEISNWANSIPNHNLKNLGEFIHIDKVLFKPSYKISINTLFENRKLAKEEKPFEGEVIPPQEFSEIDKVDIWSINIPFDKKIKKTSDSLIVKGSQEIYDCYKCHAIGYLTCENCNGIGTIRCSECNGFGENTCTDCNGTGIKTCSTCNGTGENVCYYCHGSGIKREISGYGSNGNRQYINVSCVHCQNGYKTCSSCNGVGENKCWTCKGAGIIVCRNCMGNGTINCKDCKGTGSIVCSNCDGKTKILKFIKIYSNKYPKSLKYNLFDNNLNKIFKNEEIEKKIMALKGKVLIDFNCNYIENINLDFNNILSNDLQKLVSKSHLDIPKEISRENTKIIYQHLFLTEIPEYEIYYQYEKKKYEMLIYNDTDGKMNNYKIISLNDPVLEIYKDYIKKSKSALASKDYTSALDNIDKAISMYPTKSEPVIIKNEIYLVKAQSLLDFGNYILALTEINNAISVDPSNKEQYRLKNIILRKIYLPYRIGIIAGLLLYQMIIGFSLLLKLKSINDISTQNSLINVSSPLIVILFLMFLFIGNIFKTKIKTNKWRFYLGLIFSGLVSIVAGYLFIIL